MARKSSESLRKKLIIALVVLFVVQIATYFLISSRDTTPKTADEAINKAVEKSSANSDERRDLLKVQIALSSYMNKHNGIPPTQLASLIPEYLDTIPSNPDGTQIKYRTEGKKYFLGDSAPKIDNKFQNSPKGEDKAQTALSASDKDQLIEVLTKDTDERLAHYDPSNKRDPFKPMKISSDGGKSSGKTQLESYSLDKLSYSAFLQTDTEPKAIIENTEGRGFTITKGTKVGTNNGVVTDIFPDRIIVVESTIDFTGATQTKTFEFVIGAKGAKTSRK
jgi:Tfp pilus assembly protein PilP